MPSPHASGGGDRPPLHSGDLVGRTEVLLSVPAQDFGWQSDSTLSAPRGMPEGTRIGCLAHFDNSSERVCHWHSRQPNKEVGR